MLFRSPNPSPSGIFRDIPNPGHYPAKPSGASRGLDPGIPAGSSRGTRTGETAGSARFWGSPLPESGTVPFPRFNDPSEKATGREDREETEMFSDGSTVPVLHDDQPENPRDSDMESSDARRDRGPHYPRFGSESRNTFVLSHSLIKVTLRSAYPRFWWVKRHI